MTSHSSWSARDAIDLNERINGQTTNTNARAGRQFALGKIALIGLIHSRIVTVKLSQIDTHLQHILKPEAEPLQVAAAGGRDGGPPPAQKRIASAR